MTTQEKANGCLHSDRPVQKHCKVCGKGICFECIIEDRISGRVTGEGFAQGVSSSGSFVTASSHASTFEYATFCGPCYLNWISKPDYKIIYKVTPKKLITIDSKKRPGFRAGELITMILLAPCFCISVFAGFADRNDRIHHYNTFLERKAKAERIAHEMKS